MRAGFARVSITPPLGTRMMGVGDRDLAHGCDSIHDDIYVRTLYIEHGGETALIMSLDLCFVGREDTDRWKGAVGRNFDILPRQIMVTATHSHVSPAVGTWYAADYAMPDRIFQRELEDAVVEAACQGYCADKLLKNGCEHSYAGCTIHYDANDRPYDADCFYVGTCEMELQ